MKVVENKSNTDFKIKIGNKYVTVATLVPWLFSKHLHKYYLYFYYYGKEEGIITVWKQEYEFWDEFIERIQKMISKKLYMIGSSILEEIKYIETDET